MTKFSAGGNPSAEPTHAGAFRAELLPGLPLLLHCCCQVLCRTPQQAPCRYGSHPDGILKFSPHSSLKRSLLIVHIIGVPRGQSLGQVESIWTKHYRTEMRGYKQSAVSNLSSCSLQGAVRDPSLLEADNSFPVPAALRFRDSRLSCWFQS